MIKMNNRDIVVVLALLVAVSTGAYFLLYSAGESRDSLTKDSGVPPDEIPDRGPGMQAGLNDTLGLKDIIIRLMTGLSEISENEGTSVDIIDLVELLKIELNTTIAGNELDEDQGSTVEQIKAQLDMVRELAENGSSVEYILDQIRPQRRSN